MTKVALLVGRDGTVLIDQNVADSDMHHGVLVFTYDGERLVLFKDRWDLAVGRHEGHRIEVTYEGMFKLAARATAYIRATARGL